MKFVCTSLTAVRSFEMSWLFQVKVTHAYNLTNLKLLEKCSKITVIVHFIQIDITIN